MRLIAIQFFFDVFRNCGAAFALRTECSGPQSAILDVALAPFLVFLLFCAFRWHSSVIATIFAAHSEATQAYHLNLTACNCMVHVHDRNQYTSNPLNVGLRLSSQFDFSI